MIKLNQEIPEVFDISDQNNLRNFLIAIKQCIVELAERSQSRQMEIRSTVPGTTDLEEGEFVAYVNGANYYIYTKQNGVIKYATLT